MAKNSSAGDFVAGFLFGAFIGAVLALLFAPARGEEVRDQIKEKSIELKGKAQELSGEATKKAESLFGEQKTRLQEAIEEGKKAAARKKEELLAQIEGTTPIDGSIELPDEG